MLKKYDYPDGSLISYMSNMVKLNGGINLAQGIPSFDPPMELKNILSELAFEKIHQYPPGNGDLELVNQIITRYEHINKDISQDKILITQGATEAIYLVYQYLKTLHRNKFSVLAFDPLYESYKYLPAIVGDELVVENYEDISYESKKLESSITENNVKLVFISSPGNPLGKSWKEEELKTLFNLAEKHDFYIVFDAVYNNLYFNEAPYNPIKKPSDKLFYINSFSKMLSITGWRIGYLICDPNHMKKIRNIHDYTGLCAASILQKAVARFLSKYNYGQEYLKELRSILKNNFDKLSQALLSEGFQIPKVDGGYFIWAKLPDNHPDGFQWAMNLYEKHRVAVIPGSHFSDKGERYIRFNIARTDKEIDDAIEKIRTFCKELRNL